MKKLVSLLPFIAIGIIFSDWFTTREVIGGDWPYFYSETLKEFSLFVPSWSSYHGNGLGGEFISYSLDSYLYFVVSLFVNGLGISWGVIYRIFFFGFFIIASAVSSIYLLKTVLPDAKIWQKSLAAFVFTLNTYILMVVGGGQMGIALAYSISPFVLARFIKLINAFTLSGKNFQFSIFNFQLALFAGIALALQVMFDPRIGYLSMIVVAIYLVLQIIKKNILNTFLPREALAKWGYLMLYVLVIPMGVTTLLHASWIFPLVVFQSSPAEGIISQQSSVGAFKFFSFASFSQSLSLLHPNWPENIFGKIGFMKPEFLILPILAFSSLLFFTNPKSKIPNPKQIQNSKFKTQNNLAIKQYNNTTIIFFSLLGLLGTFLAKGANPPFGEINIWMFTHIPGFAFFRDPTKFYVLIALSYSVLIPFSVYSIFKWLRDHREFSIFNFKFSMKSKIFNFKNCYLLLVTCYLLLLIRPAILGQLGGTFKEHRVPQEYVKLKNFIHSKNEFFRTLWIPRQQRFTFYSNLHPSVEALTLFKITSLDQVVNRLKEKDSDKYLSDLSIKYIIVPYDAFGEIFLKDRKYDYKQHQFIIEQLETVRWLKRINGFRKIAVFEISSPKEHFWLDEGKLSYKMLSPDRYSLKISTPIPTSLLFSEAYSPHWTTKIDNELVAAEKTKSGINSFKIIKVGNYDVEVYFTKEIYYRSGWVFSVLALFLLGIFFVFAKKFNI